MSAWRPWSSRQQELVDWYQPESYAVRNLQYNAIFDPIPYEYGCRFPAPVATRTFANQLCSRFP